MNLLKFVTAYEKFFPKAFAESWDKVGLLVVPDASKEIKKILLTNDLTMSVVNHAKEGCYDMIMCYHPLIFRPLKTVSCLGSWQEKVVIECIKNNIPVYAMHTVLDNLAGCMTDNIVSIFNIKRKSFIKQSSVDLRYSYKIPSKSLQSVFEYLISQNVLIDITEDQSTAHILSEIELGEQMFKDIPFISNNHEKSVKYAGSGRVIELSEPVKLLTVYDMVCGFCKSKNLSLSSHQVNSMVKTIGIVPGAGGSLLKSVDCDLILTGEMSHHDILEAIENGKHVILTNHTNLENPFIRKFGETLQYIFSMIGFPGLEVNTFIPRDIYSELT